jgi:hypothetical protein
MLKFRNIALVFLISLLLCPIAFSQDYPKEWPFDECNVEVNSEQTMADVIYMATCGRLAKPEIRMIHMQMDEFYTWLASHVHDPFKVRDLLYGKNIIWAATQRDETKPGVYVIRYWSESNGGISDLNLAHEIMHTVLWELFPMDVGYTQDEALVWRLTNHFIVSKRYKSWLRSKGI